MEPLENDPFFFHPSPPDKATSRLGCKLPGLSLEMSEPARTRGVGSEELQWLDGIWTVRAGQALTSPPALLSRVSNTDVICNPLEIHQQVNEDGKKGRKYSNSRLSVSRDELALTYLSRR